MSWDILKIFKFQNNLCIIQQVFIGGTKVDVYNILVNVIIFYYEDMLKFLWESFKADIEVYSYYV